jgi:hypothetical protein
MRPTVTGCVILGNSRVIRVAVRRVRLIREILDEEDRDASFDDRTGGGRRHMKDWVAYTLAGWASLLARILIVDLS